METCKSSHGIKHSIIINRLTLFHNVMLAFISSFLPVPDMLGARIRNRHRDFWRDPDAENVRNTLFNSDDPLDKWKNVKNWQRRLSNKYNSRNFAVAHGCK